MYGEIVCFIERAGDELHHPSLAPSNHIHHILEHRCRSFQFLFNSRLSDFFFITCPADVCTIDNYNAWEHMLSIFHPMIWQYFGSAMHSLTVTIIYGHRSKTEWCCFESFRTRSLFRRTPFGSGRIAPHLVELPSLLIISFFFMGTCVTLFVRFVRHGGVFGASLGYHYFTSSSTESDVPSDEKNNIICPATFKWCSTRAVKSWF